LTDIKNASQTTRFTDKPRPPSAIGNHAFVSGKFFGARVEAMALISAVPLLLAEIL
jgi:hypothetical protein